MRVTVCAVDELPAPGMRRCDVPGHEAIAVYHLDGRFYATADRCTHNHASLSAGWLEPSGHVVCPWHAGSFDVRTGEPAAPPCRTPLATWPVTVEDGMVVVDLGGRNRAR